MLTGLQNSMEFRCLTLCIVICYCWWCCYWFGFYWCCFVFNFNYACKSKKQAKKTYNHFNRKKVPFIVLWHVWYVKFKFEWKQTKTEQQAQRDSISIVFKQANHFFSPAIHVLRMKKMRVNTLKRQKNTHTAKNKSKYTLPFKCQNAFIMELTTVFHRKTPAKMKKNNNKQTLSKFQCRARWIFVPGKKCVCEREIMDNNNKEAPTLFLVSLLTSSNWTTTMK